jgi:hypothetical protein
MLRRYADLVTERSTRGFYLVSMEGFGDSVIVGGSIDSSTHVTTAGSDITESETGYDILKRERLSGE